MTMGWREEGKRAANEATIKVIEQAELRLNSADHEREHGSRRKAEDLYEQVLRLQDLHEAAPLLLHHAWTQGGNVARLNGHFDRSDRWHHLASDLFDDLMAGNKLTVEEKRQLALSQAANLRNHAEEVRKQATSPDFNVGQRPIAFGVARKLLGASSDLIAAHKLDLAEAGATMAFDGRLGVAVYGVNHAITILIFAHMQLSSARPHNHRYLLYCELDLMELSLYGHEEPCSGFDLELSKLALAWIVLRDLYTSLRYGNRWPRPLHFERAVFHLVMCCTPLKLRRRILRRYGRLIKTALLN